jgi:sigma-B regulation protein RsbU (phosphoserine phosphatase)
MSEGDPVEIVRTLNTALLAAADGDGERFCTALFALVTPGDPVEVELASGGHPLPVLRRAGGASDVVDVGGSLLGVLEEAEVSGARIQLHPGDTLVLVTDGVLEARNDGDFFDLEGLERVLAAPVASAGAAASAVEQAVLRHTGGVLSDDMAAVVLHVPVGT